MPQGRESGLQRDTEDFTDDEIARRRDELAKHMLGTPPRPLKPHKAKAESKAIPKKRGGGQTQEEKRKTP